MSALFSFLSFLVVIGLIVFFSMKFMNPPQTLSNPEGTGTLDAIDLAKDAKNMIETRTQTEVNMGGN